MRTLTLVLTLFLLTAPAAAQEATPVAEVSGGYSLIPEDSWDGQNWWSGWLIAGSVTITRWFGVAAEVGANYYSDRVSFEGFEFDYSEDTRFAGVGPRFAARGRRVTGFGQLLVGAQGGDGYNDFAIQAGGGVDVWLAPVIGIRAGVDGRGSWDEDGETYGSWRIHTGVVVALGTR